MTVRDETGRGSYDYQSGVQAKAIGDYEKAWYFFEQALSLQKQAPTIDPAEIAATLDELSAVLDELQANGRSRVSHVLENRRMGSLENVVSKWAETLPVG